MDRFNNLRYSSKQLLQSIFPFLHSVKIYSIIIYSSVNNMVIKRRSNMEDRSYTKEEIIGITINLLGQIKVPAEEARQIALPIQDAQNNLRVVMEMIQKEKELAKQEQEKVDVAKEAMEVEEDE